MAAASPAARFVGRSRELGALLDAARAAAGGSPSAWLVGGEAGVGKTRLVQELLARAAQGDEPALALAGGCLDIAGGGLPMWPFVQALRAHAAQLPRAERADVFGGEGSQLTRLLPELGGGGGVAGATAQGRLFELVLGLLGRLSQRTPVVLVVEDLHWADRSTRDLLAFIARSLRRERLLLVATYRSDDLFRGHPLRASLAELHRSRAARRLELGALAREDLREHLRSLARQRPADAGAPESGSAGTTGEPSAALLQSVVERSEGNPFYAEELFAAAAEGGGADLPATLRDILLARVEHRSPPAQELLRAAAAGGRSVRAELLAAVAPGDGRERLAALRELAAHQLLVSDGPDSHGFRHALLREAVYAELLPDERVGLHAAYGAALAGRPQLAGDPALAAAELAHHWLAAHDLPRALAASVRAGEQAAARWGFAEALEHDERALELWLRVPDAREHAGVDRLTLRRRAAEAANLAGEHRRAGALMRAAVEDADPGTPVEVLGVMWVRLGRFLWAAGDSDEALQAYETALALVPERPPTAARARVLAAHAQALMLLSRYEEARGRCEQAIATARAVGARAEEGHALNTLGTTLGFLGDPEGAVARLRQALAIAREVGDLDDLGRAYLNLAEVLAGPLNRLAEAAELAREGAEESARAGLANDYGVSLDCRAALALMAEGRWDEADGLLRGAEERAPQEMAAADVHLCRARLEAARGAFEIAEHHLDAVRRLIVKTIDPQVQSVMHAHEAELALWQRRPRRALAGVEAGLRSLDGSDDVWLLGPLLWLGARALADGPDSSQEIPARAAALLDGAAGALVDPVTRAYARMSLAEGVRADAAAWRAVAEEWAALGHPYPRSYAQWREAEALLAGRQGRRGTAVLQEAHATAQRLGAAPLAGELEALARRARVRLEPAPAAPAPPVEPPDADAAALGLTRRELQVLALVAAGRTNREIAAELFVTEKTAAAHVSSILGKLGARGRVEAATAAHRLGLLDEQPAAR